jgi:hypothetical protein
MLHNDRKCLPVRKFSSALTSCFYTFKREITVTQSNFCIYITGIRVLRTPIQWIFTSPPLQRANILQTVKPTLYQPFILSALLNTNELDLVKRCAIYGFK